MKTRAAGQICPYLEHGDQEEKLTRAASMQLNSNELMEAQKKMKTRRTDLHGTWGPG
jgi:hypothetical protein